MINMDSGKDFIKVMFEEETVLENWTDSCSSFQMEDEKKEVNQGTADCDQDTANYDQDTANCEHKWNLQQKAKELLNLLSNSSLFRWFAIFLMLLMVIVSSYMFLKLIGFGIRTLEREINSEEKFLLKKRSNEEQAELSINGVFQQIEGQSLKLNCKIWNLNCMKEKHDLKESGNENILKEGENLPEKLEIQSWNLNCMIESILDDAKFNDARSPNANIYMRNKQNIPVIKFHSTENIKPKLENEGFDILFYDHFKKMKDTFSGVFQTCLEIPKALLKVGKALLSVCQEHFKKWEKRVEILIAVLFFTCVAFKLVLPDYIINFEKYVIFFYLSINFVHFTLVLLL